MEKEITNSHEPKMADHLQVETSEIPVFHSRMPHYDAFVDAINTATQVVVREWEKQHYYQQVQEFALKFERLLKSLEGEQSLFIAPLVFIKKYVQVVPDFELFLEGMPSSNFFFRLEKKTWLTKFYENFPKLFFDKLWMRISIIEALSELSPKARKLVSIKKNGVAYYLLTPDSFTLGSVVEVQGIEFFVAHKTVEVMPVKSISKEEIHEWVYTVYEEFIQKLHDNVPIYEFNKLMKKLDEKEGTVNTDKPYFSSN